MIGGQNGDEDGAKAVGDGRLSATVDLVPWRTGLMLETISKAILDGKKVPSYVESPTELYTKENLADRVTWDDAQSEIASGAMTCADGGGCPDDVAALVK